MTTVSPLVVDRCTLTFLLTYGLAQPCLWISGRVSILPSRRMVNVPPMCPEMTSSCTVMFPFWFSKIHKCIGSYQCNFKAGSAYSLKITISLYISKVKYIDKKARFIRVGRLFTNCGTSPTLPRRFLALLALVPSLFRRWCYGVLSTGSSAHAVGSITRKARFARSLEATSAIIGVSASTGLDNLVSLLSSGNSPDMHAETSRSLRRLRRRFSCSGLSVPRVSPAYLSKRFACAR